MKIVANYREDKKQWLEERKKRITASEVSSALGLNPYQSAFELWAQKTGLVETPELSSEAIKWGSRLETPIALGWCEDTGKEIEPAGDLIAHPSLDFLAATPDFYVGEKELLECKLSGSYKVANQFQDGNTPDHYQVQMLVQLVCTDRELAHLAALIQGTRLEVRQVERNPYLESLILEQIGQFWEMVKTKTPPPLTESDNDLISELYPVDPHKEILLGADTQHLIDMYLEAQDAEKQAKKKKDTLKAELKRRLEGAKTALAINHKITLTQVHSTSLNVDKLRAEKMEIWREYARPSSYQTMRISPIRSNK